MPQSYHLHCKMTKFSVPSDRNVYILDINFTSIFWKVFHNFPQKNFRNFSVIFSKATNINFPPWDLLFRILYFRLVGPVDSPQTPCAAGLPADILRTTLWMGAPNQAIKQGYLPPATLPGPLEVVPESLHLFFEAKVLSGPGQLEVAAKEPG